MEDNQFEKIMKKTADGCCPDRMFAVKMRYRLWKKGLVIYFTGHHAKMHFAGATLVMFLFFGGGVGAYAYASPDVNVSHPLFAVKQGLENVEGSLAFSPEQKADFFMRQAMRRMDEAERMHFRLEQRLEMSDEAEAAQRTLEMINLEMDRSFEYAAGEFDPEKAEEMVKRMEEKCSTIHERIEGLPPLQNGRPHISALHEKMTSLDDATLEKLDELRQARQTVMQARQGRHNRVMLRFLPPPPPLIGE